MRRFHGPAACLAATLLLAGCEPRVLTEPVARGLLAEHVGAPVVVTALEAEPGGLWRVTWRPAEAGAGEPGRRDRLRHWNGRWRLVIETDTAERLRLL